MIASQELSNIKAIGDGLANGVKKTEIITFVLGVTLFAITSYAMYLSVKANKLQIRQLNDQGYE